MSALFLGIDPGIVNTGWYVLGEDLKTTGFGGVFNPSAYATRATAVQALLGIIEAACDENFLKFSDIQVATVERYVAYMGRMNSNTEPTVLLIGSLTYPLETCGITILEKRAIDWKIAVNKDLFKTVGFHNPSEKLDKVYSLAAAQEIAGRAFDKRKDHEADACCMAYLSYMHYRDNPEFYNVKNVVKRTVSSSAH